MHFKVATTLKSKNAGGQYGRAKPPNIKNKTPDANMEPQREHNKITNLSPSMICAPHNEPPGHHTTAKQNIQNKNKSLGNHLGIT